MVAKEKGRIASLVVFISFYMLQEGLMLTTNVISCFYLLRGSL